MRKYFEVRAKAGHVGKGNYTIISLFVTAKDRRDAAKIARWKPRVKHHAKNAIVDVVEITYDEYTYGLSKNANDPFLNSKNIQEQRESCINLEVIPVEYGQYKKQMCMNSNEKKTLRERNPRKYLKYSCGKDIRIELQEYYAA